MTASDTLTKATDANASAVSRLLGSAGFMRAVKVPRYMSGSPYQVWSTGYDVRQEPTGAVSVAQRWARGALTDDTTAAMLTSYAAVLRAAGYTVRQSALSLYVRKAA